MPMLSPSLSPLILARFGWLLFLSPSPVSGDLETEVGWLSRAFVLVAKGPNATEGRTKSSRVCLPQKELLRAPPVSCVILVRCRNPAVHNSPRLFGRKKFALPSPPSTLLYTTGLKKTNCRVRKTWRLSSTSNTPIQVSIAKMAPGADTHHPTTHLPPPQIPYQTPHPDAGVPGRPKRPNNHAPKWCLHTGAGVPVDQNGRK